MILKLEKKGMRENQAQLFIETPYRNQSLFKDLLATLAPTTLLCIGCDLTLATEFIKTLTVKEWKSQRPNLEKKPCIFIIEAGF